MIFYAVRSANNRVACLKVNEITLFVETYEFGADLEHNWKGLYDHLKFMPKESLRNFAETPSRLH